MGNMRRKKRIKKPKGSSESRTLAYSSGMMAARILLPSRGGIGIRLKAAKRKL